MDAAQPRTTTPLIEVSGRHVLITGSQGGIGRALSAALRDAGARVSGVDIAAEADFTCDVTDPTQVAETVRRLEEAGGPVDTVVLAAGRFPNRSFEQWTLAEFEDLWRLNVGGCFNILQETLASLRSSGRGRIIAISSNAVLQGIPGFAPYAATKSALVGMIRSLASEVAGDQVTANVVTPGLTETEAAVTGDVAGFFDAVVASQMVQRRLQAGDLAGIVLLLCSEAASMITGQIVNVDAGSVTH